MGFEKSRPKAKNCGSSATIKASLSVLTTDHQHTKTHTRAGRAGQAGERHTTTRLLARGMHKHHHHHHLPPPPARRTNNAHAAEHTSAGTYIPVETKELACTPGATVASPCCSTHPHMHHCYTVQKRHTKLCTSYTYTPCRRKDGCCHRQRHTSAAAQTTPTPQLQTGATLSPIK